MKIFRIIFVIIGVIFWAGCNSVTVLENDITLDELEDCMEKAMDPKGVFAESKSYYQSQSLKYEGIFTDDLYEIQIRYLKPHFLKVTTLKFNQLQSAFIFNGNAAWSVDYREKTAKNLSGVELVRVKSLYEMLTPGCRYSKLFKTIDFDKIKAADGKVYYRLTCSLDDEENKLIVYINADTFLKEKIYYDFTTEIKGKKHRIKSESVIETYDTVNSVLYPLEMKSITNGVESEIVVAEYRLNVELDESEFQPPLFPNEPENRKKHKLELQKRQEKANNF